MRLASTLLSPARIRALTPPLTPPPSLIISTPLLFGGAAVGVRSEVRIRRTRTPRHAYEENLSTVENPAEARLWLPETQRHQGRSQSAQQPPPRRPQAPDCGLNRAG
jgi:hypothetical protein